MYGNHYFYYYAALFWHNSLTVELYDYQRKDIFLIGIKTDLTRGPLSVLDINKGLIIQNGSYDQIPPHLKSISQPAL